MESLRRFFSIYEVQGGNFLWTWCDSDMITFFIAKLRTFHFFIEIENFRGEGKILMRHTHDTTFSEKILEFYKILEESKQFFILFLKKMESLRRFFSIFEVRGGNFFFNVVWLRYDHFYFYCKTDNLSCLNNKNCLVKLKNFSCIFMSSAWINTWGSLCQSFCLFYSFFQCQI